MSSSIRHYWFWTSYYSFDHRYDLCKSSIYSYFYKYYMTKVQGGKIFSTCISYILFIELKNLQPFSSDKKYSRPSFFGRSNIIGKALKKFNVIKFICRRARGKV